MTKTYAGALVGTGTVQMLTCAMTGYVANERVVGVLDGREGTFVLQHGV